MMRLLTKIVTMPLEVLASSMETFSRVLRDIQRTLDETSLGLADPARASVPALALEDSHPSTASATNSRSDTLNQCNVSARDLRYKEKSHMPDQDLSGDDLKLVRYKILFTKRGYEWAFPEDEELVHDDMDAGRFTAWKISEFIQAMKDGHGEKRKFKISDKWGKALVGKAKEDQDAGLEKHQYVTVEGNRYYIRDVPHDDKKFLRLFFEVLDRFPREDLHYEERQIEVLEQIRDKMSPHGGGGASQGGGAKSGFSG
jgi:hypothetical protein